MDVFWERNKSSILRLILPHFREEKYRSTGVLSINIYWGPTLSISQKSYCHDKYFGISKWHKCNIHSEATGLKIRFDGSKISLKVPTFRKNHWKLGWFMVSITKNISRKHTSFLHRVYNDYLRVNKHWGFLRGYISTEIFHSWF